MSLDRVARDIKMFRFKNLEPRSIFGTAMGLLIRLHRNFAWFREPESIKIILE